MMDWDPIADELGDSGFQRVLGCKEIVSLAPRVAIKCGPGLETCGEDRVMRLRRPRALSIRARTALTVIGSTCCNWIPPAQSAWIVPPRAPRGGWVFAPSRALLDGNSGRRSAV
jgi:hypothetical protein